MYGTLAQIKEYLSSKNIYLYILWGNIIGICSKKSFSPVINNHAFFILYNIPISPSSSGVSRCRLPSLSEC